MSNSKRTRLVALLSGGIDSPVASYIMSLAGADVLLLHMNNGMYADPKELEKVKLLAERLETVTGKEFPLYVADHETNQTAIKETCDQSYQCVMCKRVMQRSAREFAKLNGCSGILMGDSLGQVASQTLRNIKAEGTGLDFPVVRPLIGMDKLEIIAIAERIGTYPISIMQTSGCGVVPLRPITEARTEKVETMDESLDLDALAIRTAGSAKRIR